MKKVLSPDMVAHTFAHQSQDEARNSNGSLFFEHRSIYSYGKHFCIASFIQNVDGEEKLLFTTRSYSNTTARHIRIVEKATSHLDKIYCPYPDQNYNENLTVFKSDIKGELKGLAKAKKPEKYIKPAEAIYNQCVEYCNFFDIHVPADITELIDSAKTGAYAEYLQAEAARIEKERKEAEQERINKHKKELTKWRSGKLDRIYGRTNEDYLRIKNDRIQTSQNVEIPIELGKKLFELLHSYQTAEIGKKYALAEKIHNFKILDYKVNNINDSDIQAGCHHITFKEINKLAKKLNWI